MDHIENINLDNTETLLNTFCTHDIGLYMLHILSIYSIEYQSDPFCQMCQNLLESKTFQVEASTLFI